MEETHRVQPLGCDFELEVPSRNADWYTERGYEPFSTAVFRSSARGVDVVVDIGAHVGYFSLLAASANPEVRVIAVEASPDNVAVLKRNFSSAARDSIELLEGAFGASNVPREFQLTEASDNSGSSGHPNSPTLSVVTVPGLTGTDLMIEPGQRVLVKLDVEGHELAALAGLERVLAETAELRLLVEYNPKCMRQAGSEPSALLDWIYEHDFRVFALDESSSSWDELHRADEGLEDRVARGYLNLYCLPRETAVSVVGVLHSAGLGGAERSHVEFVEDLVSEGGMIATVAPRPDQGVVAQLAKAGSSIVQVSDLQWWVLQHTERENEGRIGQYLSGLVSRELVEVLRSVAPDVVVTQTSVIPQGAIAAALLRIPHVWWIREFGDLDHGFRYPLSVDAMGTAFTELSELILTNGTGVSAHFFSTRLDKSVPVVESRPSPRAMSRREVSQGNSPEVFTLGVVGGFQPGKGHETVFRAAHAILQGGRNVVVRLVGSGSPSDRRRLKRLASESGVLENVEFAGSASDSEAIYSGLSAVVVPSRSEAFGRVPFEAADFGLPVLYADAGGPREYMRTEVTGLSFPVGDHVELAVQVVRLYEDKMLSRQLTLNWRSEVQRLRNDRDRVVVLVNLIRQASRHFRETNWRKLIRSWILEGPQRQLEESQRRLEESQRQLEESQRQLEDSERQLEDSERQLVQQSHDLGLLDSRLKAAMAHQEVLEGDLGSVRAALAASTAELDRVLMERQYLTGRLEEMLASRSWRVTRPMRWLSRILGRSVRTNQEP